MTRYVNDDPLAPAAQVPFLPWLADHWGWTASLLVAALIAFCGGVMWLRIDAAQALEE